MDHSVNDRIPMTLAEALQAEIKRVRDDIMPGFIRIGTAGEPGLAMMRAEMDLSIKALAEQDVTACIKWLESLRGYTG